MVIASNPQFSWFNYKKGWLYIGEQGGTVIAEYSTYTYSASESGKSVRANFVDNMITGGSKYGDGDGKEFTVNWPTGSANK